MNEETQKLGLIEEKGITASLLGRSISATPGFSKEIFQGGKYLGSVRLSAERSQLSADSPVGVAQMKIRTECLLLMVNLGPQTMILKGIFSTKDRYSASYEIAVEVRVHNPLLFAQRYLQKSDPIGLLKASILQDIDEYAARTDHDSLNPAKLRHDVRYNTQSAKIGLLVTEIYKTQIYADPRLARIHEMEQDAQVDKATINTTFEIDMLRENRTSALKGQHNDNERKEQAKANQFERDEQKRAQDALRQQQITDMLTGKLTDRWMQQIDTDIYNNNSSMDDILENDPRLLNLFSSIFPADRSAELEQGTKHQSEIEVKQEKIGPPSSTPPDPGQIPPLPIHESDIGEFREITNEDEDEDEK